MTKFFYLKQVRSPEDIREHLAAPHQLKEGFSAYELAKSWIEADGIPSRVEQVLDGSDAFRGAELVEAFFERQVDLRSPGRPSQTDLLALVRTDAGYAVFAVEGKAEESFGPVISE
jgi:hypothetical protein